VHLADNSRPFPGVATCLARLAEQGYALAVCTNKSEGFSHDLLGQVGLSGFFGAVVGGDTLPVRKPDPGHIHGTLERLGGGPFGWAAMIGDSANDINAAGLNSALQRAPRIETTLLALPKGVTLGPSWKPTRPRVVTFGLTFAEGTAFLPPKSEKKPDEDLRSLEPPKAELPTVEEETGVEAPKRPSIQTSHPASPLRAATRRQSESEQHGVPEPGCRSPSNHSRSLGSGFSGGAANAGAATSRARPARAVAPIGPSTFSTPPPQTR